MYLQTVERVIVIYSDPMVERLIIRIWTTFQNNCWSFCMLPHSLHLLQLLDVSVFAVLNSIVYKNIIIKILDGRSRG
jgi:hypothetical protein